MELEIEGKPKPAAVALTVLGTVPFHCNLLRSTSRPDEQDWGTQVAPPAVIALNDATAEDDRAVRSARRSPNPGLEMT